jgi:hypothetical protein
MFAVRREEVIARLRPGISIKKVMITMFFTVQQLIAMNALAKGQKYDQEYFVQNIFPSLFNEKKHFSHQKIMIKFFVHMNNSMYQNRHRVVDELRRLKILTAPHSPYSPDISPYNFWIFEDFKGKQKDCHLQGPKEIPTVFQELEDKITFEELQIIFESCRDRLRWIIEHDGEYFRK